MAKLETRRVNPIAHVTFVAVAILIFFEVLIVFGVFELRSQTVAKYAPWAYEPFLRLVGEHPESAPRWASIDKPKETEMAPTNAVPEPIVPVVVPTNAPAAKLEEIVPVG